MTRARQTIRIVSPSSRGPDHLLPQRIQELEHRGFRVLYDDLAADARWPFTVASVRERAEALTQAMEEKDSQILLCARGGYGASDLLPHLPWKRLEKAKEKWLIGFSDVSALHAAVHTRLGWPCVHGPMPKTELWARGGGADVAQLLSLLTGEIKEGSAPLTYAVNAPAECRGWLFGGCLSVLTNLVGTPYLPRLTGAVLFWEDIAENPGRVMRAVNQWGLAGLLEGVRAIVLGRFVDLQPSLGIDEHALAREIAERWRLPVFVTPAFGHIAPNWPLPLGAEARLGSGTLTWQLKGTTHGRHS